MATRNTHSYLPLSTRSFHLLLAIAEEPMNGYQIMQRVRENSDGVVKIHPGTLYETLSKFAEEGIVSESRSAGVEKNGRGQKYFQLTAFGKKVFAAESERLAADLRAARRTGALG